MTEQEARNEAVKRWGHTAFVEEITPEESGLTYPTYNVGYTEYDRSVGFDELLICGTGDSYAEAFHNADKGAV